MALPDFVPLILGGDIGAYALGREFHEACGVRSICASQGPIDAITKSRIFECTSVSRLDDAEVERVVRETAAAHADQKVLLITNLESVVGCVCRLEARLPENVVTPTPSLESVEALAHKDRFIRLCRERNLPTPATEIVDLSDGTAILPSKIAFPVVAKPSFSAEYAPFIAQGFRKVYLMHSQAELDELWEKLRSAGFAGTFLVQEFVPGDDTMNETVTVYVTHSGRISLLSGARTILNDHSPSLMGNSVAMLTQEVPELYDQVSRLLEGMDYHGYACVDVKRDPRDGRALFLEINPRVGRNSYYVSAAGENPMGHCIEELVFGREPKEVRTSREALYTLVPRGLLRRYLTDNSLYKRVENACRAGLVFDPQRYAHDKGASRMLSVSLTELNQYRKFAKYYPEQSSSSF
ncbi:hypothetical protein AUL39_06770 [Tractidigestivibacter scatoligenes]|uniref:ATP-grasp domain-containing protein n=1 Tax=Tractidigestivibacter scatoligenes TaxID=1299998 RepID=A0A100YWE6_TRASO|nr:ATP-grasp domain-containing protein [Tractidigestivibacter scatoligenes]KUH58667.1 hypothetical protein AUL39_06770 [Tractidigestivibacter scatoligenes]